MNLYNFNHSHADYININYKYIPVTEFNIDKEGCEKFSKIFKYILSLKPNKMFRTRSGGICTRRDMINNQLFSYDLTIRNNGCELIFINDGQWRFQLRNKRKYKVITGSKAFKIFKLELLKDNIDLNKYAISKEKGLENKSLIPKPMIKLTKESYKDKIFKNCCHIDFHSSYMAGLANTYPEFRKTIDRLYSERKELPYYKSVLTNTFGYMQSEYCGYKYSHLARCMIEDNNKRIKHMAKYIEDKGYKIIAYNTDGIWYQGKPINNPNGDKLGEWCVDEEVSKLRFKTKGCYEFIRKNGTYVSRARGVPEEVKKDWKWGDIYTHTQPKYYLNETTGDITYEEVEIE